MFEAKAVVMQVHVPSNSNIHFVCYRFNGFNNRGSDFRMHAKAP